MYSYLEQQTCRVLRCALGLALAALGGSEVRGQSLTFAGNPNHTGLYSTVLAQHLQAIHWSTSVDLDNAAGSSHYGAPLITFANTVIAAVRTSTNYVVSAFDGQTGRLKYTLNTDYVMPPLPNDGWTPVYQPVLARPAGGWRLYYPGAGGTVYCVDTPDSDVVGTPTQLCFYADLGHYRSNAASFNTNVFINTPITADTNGSIFFGFRMQAAAAPPLNTTNSGFVRIAPDGNARYVLAGPAASDGQIYRDTHSAAPALSNDGATLYVAVKGATATYAYLLGLDTTTLATKYKRLLLDPRRGGYASVSDNGTASPVVGPDGDVYFGVLVDNGSRGFLLHFSSDLTVLKTPGAFGWDNTPAVVPVSMVPGYHGTSPYLLFTKYNNYAGNNAGDGVNRLALLDPNSTQTDPHPEAAGLQEMREVLTVLGPTPDAEFLGAAYPEAVREWCINTAAVNPATHSIFAPSEDGHLYRWDIATNALTEVLKLGAGLGEPYVPTALGPDGTIYTLNGGSLFAVGNSTNLSLMLASSTPDLRSVTASQSLAFTVTITNQAPNALAPTGTVTFLDLTYRGLAPVTNQLATALPLLNGSASVSNVTLSAGGNERTNCLGNHFITASYSGDAQFPAQSVSLVQKVHAQASVCSIVAASPSNGVAVITAQVSGAADVPGGLVTFFDGTQVMGQVPLTNGAASLMISPWPSGSHAFSAEYNSDTVFASSKASILPEAPVMFAIKPAPDSLQISFTNTIGAPFTVLRGDDLGSLTNWVPLGPAVESSPGRFRFTDSSASGSAQRFYRVRSP